MIGLIRTVLILLLVYYVFKILAQWLGPKLLAYAARKTEERFRGHFGTFNSGNTEGEIKIDDSTIHKNTKKRNTSAKKVGEYIDFEEIE